jgi:hypothetical protein
MSETTDRAIAVVVDQYRHTKAARMVDSGEVFWDREFRLTVALYGVGGDLLAVYRITGKGIQRAAKRLPVVTYPLTRDNPHLLVMIDAVDMLANSNHEQ